MARMNTGGAALALSVLALGAGVYALTTTEKQSPQRAPARMDRVAALEAQVADLTREIESLKTDKPGRIDRSMPSLPSVMLPADAGDVERPADIVDEGGTLKAIVDAAVDRKTKQVMDDMRIKTNKKPAMDVFASVLELNDRQRAAAERVVVDGQTQVHAILETPTADGRNLMDDLIDIVAKRIAQPGKDHGWGPLFALIVSEKIPGTDETYGTRIESVKNRMRETFKRDWSEAQYREFEQWGVDPTEIEKVPDSPNTALMERIMERAKTLGADIPDDK